MDVSLECVGVSKQYASHLAATTVLDNFSLSLHAGEIGMLMGPSGCGKTTLLMILGGILAPDKGICKINTYDIYSMSQKEKVRFRAQHISFLFQHLHLFPALSALENIALPLIIDGIETKIAQKQAAELMLRLGLEQHINSPLEILSGGQKQRVAIGRALIRAPSLILCDEPTSNLDKDCSHTIFSVIQDYAKQQGCTFLICTHDNRITSYATTMVKFKGLNEYEVSSL